MDKKAFLSNYEHDIFVSYAHEEQLGAWTVALQEDLRKALNLILLSKSKGRYVDVWIDQILRNNLPLTDQLLGTVQGSALLLIVMSPFYLGSDWCGKEVAWFAAAARSRIASDRRIFIVHAWPTDRTSWPSALAELTPYPFFARHVKANIELPLGLIGDDEDKVAYKSVLYNLAGQIRQQIEELLHEAEPPPPPESPPAPIAVPLQLAGIRCTSARLVSLEVAGVAHDNPNIERGIRRLLKDRNVQIFLPADLGPTPRDPLRADRLLQKLLKAKAACDGLLFLRLDNSAPVGDWLLDYLSEVRPMAPRVRADQLVPPALLIDAASPSVGLIPKTLEVLRFEAPEFADCLTAWIDRLPLASEVTT